MNTELQINKKSINNRLHRRDERKTLKLTDIADIFVLSSTESSNLLGGVSHR